MKTKATFYHAGCPICINAEQTVLNALDSGGIQIVRVLHGMMDIDTFF